MEFAREFLAFLRSRKKVWLIPLIAVFMIFGTILVVGQGSVVAPFIYTLF